MNPDRGCPDLATATLLATPPRAPARVPRRTRVALIVASGIAIVGLLARPFLGTTPTHAELAPATAQPTPPPAGAGAALNDTVSAIAQHAATRALACPSPALKATVHSAGGACGLLVISATAVLPPNTASSGAPDAKDQSTLPWQCGQCWTVEITGQLIPATTNTSLAGATTSMLGSVGIPVALRVTVARTSTGWATQVGQP